METETSTTPNPSPPPLRVDPPTAGCENCGAPLYGKYCYACGQPVHGLVRHFGSVMSDVADSLFNVDERLFRTLGPLYLRPGRLTLDYFAGKRARYVTPFRLVFFLAIIAFFAIQLTVRAGYREVIHVKTPPVAGVSISSAPTPGTTEVDKHFSDGSIRINNRVVWNRESKPLDVGWLPGAVNTWLNDLIGNAQQQLHAMNSGSAEARLEAGRKLTLGMYSAAPTVLFVLLPLFALLLKVFYIFKRRLYMEHLIVAMHSHAFLMFSMLVLVAINLLQAWIVPHAGALKVPFWLLQAAAWIWMFMCLWLMQKRVYRQGWFMTTLKYCCIGLCYSVMIGFGFAFAVLLSLTGA